MPDSPVRVALLGPSGVGRFHAREFARAGARIVGVLASTPERSRQAAAELGAALGYGIVAFANLEEAIASPVDAVSVCTPPAQHLAAIEAALAAGKYVFAEKPLFWRDGLTEAAAAHLASALEGRAKGRLLVNTSNVTFLEAYAARYGLPERIHRFAFRFHTHGRFRFDAIGVDLLPHALSLLLALQPGGEIGVLRRDVAAGRFTCTFDFSGIDVRFDLGEGPEQPRMLSFAINDLGVRRIQEESAAGVRVFLESEGQKCERFPVEDPFRAFIGRFVRTVETGGRFDAEAPTIRRNVTLLAALMTRPSAHATPRAVNS